MSNLNKMIYATYPDLADKRVVITGGGTGIGAELVNAFVQQGAKVVFLDIAEQASRDLAESLSGARHQPGFMKVNLMDLDAIAAAFAEIETTLGQVEILVNNAANDDRHELLNVDGAYWESRMAVNLRHLYFCAKAVVPGMIKAGGGAILNFGSISWHLALPELSLYMTAKAAIEGMSRGLARDLGKHNIRVNAIIPGAVRTPRQEALWTGPEEGKKIMAAQLLQTRVEVEDVAALTLFLASNNARACSGREYFVDAGWYGA